MGDPLDLPFQQAIDFFRQKVRVPTARWTDVMREMHDRMFMVAGAGTDALLKDFQEAILKALEQGTSLAEFRRDFDAIVQRHGWSYHGTPGWRSEIIYQTNLSHAYAAGRYAQMTDPEVLAYRPYWQYVHGHPRRPRPQHLAWDGLILPADHPWWNTHYPPNGWRCSCRVRALSDRQVSRLGGLGTAPPVEYYDWHNKSTGQIERIPVGIDPGFDYHIGRDWLAGTAGAAPAVQAAALAALVFAVCQGGRP